MLRTRLVDRYKSLFVTAVPKLPPTQIKLLVLAAPRSPDAPLEALDASYAADALADFLYVD